MSGVVAGGLAVTGIAAAPAQAAITASVGSNDTITSPAPNGVAGSDHVVTLTVGGLSRSFRLFVPSATPPANYRLVVALHPLHGSASGFETSSNLDAGAASSGALVAYPSGVAGSWNAGTCCETARDTHVADVAFLDALIDNVEATYPIDPNQIAMGGFSNGALMTYRYVCERSSRVQVAFMGSGAFVAPKCTFDRPVQILHIHGMKDAIVPWNGTTSSSYTSDHIMPSVRTTTNVVSAADGCTPGKWFGTAVSSVVNKYAASGCPSGVSVVVYQAQPLPHGWVTGPDAVKTYGVNETNMAWSFMLGAWKSIA